MTGCRGKGIRRFQEIPNRAGGSVPGAPMGRSKSPEGVPDALKRVPGEPEALFQMVPKGFRWFQVPGGFRAMAK